MLFVDPVLKPGAMDVYAVNGPWSENQITFNTPPPLGALLQSAVPVTKTGYLALDLTAADANGLIYAIGGATDPAGTVVVNTVEQYALPVTVYTFI